MALTVIEVDHFDGGGNQDQGSRGDHGNDEILSEILRKDRTAKVVAAGAGDEVVTFNTPFADNSYTVSYMFEDSAAGGLQTAMIKQGTLAAAGFTATVTGAGTFHFIAKHD